MVSVAIVGGGFGGVGAAALLTRAGFPDVTVFERSDRIGGVWNDNRYPGAACDIPSHLYEFSFAPNPNWSRRYAPQAEIQRYLEQVVEREGLRGRIHTGIEVTAARWDAERGSWWLQSSTGEREFDVLVAACGQLSAPKYPEIPGRESFEGPSFHTARWPRELALAGRRVAVIGTGASAIQAVPAIAGEAAHVDVYQRTPAWVLPRRDFAFPRPVRALFARVPLLQRLDRELNFWVVEALGLALTRVAPMRRLLEWYCNRRRRRAIADPELRARLAPDYEFGCKRVIFSDDWYPALARPDVELVTDEVAEITPTGVRTADGRERAADVLVYATGFDSHAFVSPMQITGAEGRTLQEAWGELPRAYLGITVPQFPNMFLIYGPNTNSGAGSVIFTIEAAVGHVAAALRERQRLDARTVTVETAAAERFDRQLRAALGRTVYHSGCSSWYLDERGNDPSQWPWLWSTYRHRTAELIPGDYRIV